MRHVIVGIDPGKTAAIACLDLSGRVVHLSHARFVGFEWFVGQIRSVGTPVIIASDKKGEEGTLSRLAAAFGSRVYVPRSDMSVRKKKFLIENEKPVESLHERDALAAAVNAYNAYANKFNQAEKLAREHNYENIDELKAMVVMKFSMYETMTYKRGGKRK